MWKVLGFTKLQPLAGKVTAGAGQWHGWPGSGLTKGIRLCCVTLKIASITLTKWHHRSIQYWNSDESTLQGKVHFCRIKCQKGTWAGLEQYLSMVLLQWIRPKLRAAVGPNWETTGAILLPQGCCSPTFSLPTAWVFCFCVSLVTGWQKLDLSRHFHPQFPGVSCNPIHEQAQWCCWKTGLASQKYGYLAELTFPWSPLATSQSYGIQHTVLVPCLGWYYRTRLRTTCRQCLGHAPGASAARTTQLPEDTWMWCKWRSHFCNFSSG